MAVIGHLVPPLAALIPGIPRVLGAGREVGVGYNSVPVQWHALLLIAWIVADWRVIVTPEVDVNSEMISMSNNDLVGLRVRPLDLTMSRGIDPNSFQETYQRPGLVTFGQLLQQEVTHANLKRARQGIAPYASMITAQELEAVHTGPARAAGVALPGEAFPGGGCAAAPAMGPAAGYAGIGGPLPVGGGLWHQQPLRWKRDAFIHLGQSASEVGQRQPFFELKEVRQPRRTCPRWGKTHRTVWQEPH